MSIAYNNSWEQIASYRCSQARNQLPVRSGSGSCSRKEFDSQGEAFQCCSIIQFCVQMLSRLVCPKSLIQVQADLLRCFRWHRKRRIDWEVDHIGKVYFSRSGRGILQGVIYHSGVYSGSRHPHVVWSTGLFENLVVDLPRSRTRDGRVQGGLALCEAKESGLVIYTKV